MRTTNAEERWRRKAAQAPLRTDVDATTLSGNPIDVLYGPRQGSAERFERDSGFPGEYPFTRGIHATMYRSRLWTMRQFSGFGTPEDTNARFHYLLANGQTGLSVAFDLPTLMGRDCDDPVSEGEVGICGVSVNSLADMRALFRGIALGEVTTSMTINAPAAMMLALYVAAAEEQGVSRGTLRGTIQADILKEFIAQKEWIYPPRPSLRIVTDIVEYCTNEMPLWNPVSISGYHIREAGSTAAQELAFTLADGFAYVDAAVARGLAVDAFAPRLSFFFNAHIDFFEEIAKFRAARRIWARRMKEQYGATLDRSLMLRFHTQTAGCSLTAQEPENNIVRTAVEALAGILGGTQSLHTNSMDETLALPSEHAATIALRTQQILAYETGVASTVDPLGGSYYVEALTDRMEAEVQQYLEHIEALGGVIPAIEQGFFQREIAEAAYRYQVELERQQKIIVGVNKFAGRQPAPGIPLLEIPARVAEEQRRRIAMVRHERSAPAVQEALRHLTDAARDGRNIMPSLLECARAYVTIGEMCGSLTSVFGIYEEAVQF